MTPATSMFSRLARALASAGGLGALLAGLPWALLTVIGNPLTDLPSLTQSWITGPMIQHLIALGVWLLWAIFTAAVGVEAVAVLRGVNTPRLAVLSPIQGVAALLVAGLLSAPVASAAAASLQLDRPATATVAGHRSVAAATPATRPAGDPDTATAPASEVMTVRVGGQHYTYRVRHGDTLWHIADVWLGNPLRWPEIYDLNRDHYDQHGRMRHGNLILPGWVLHLPADASPPPGADPAPKPPPPGPSATPTPAPSWPPPTPTPTVSVTASATASHTAAAPSSTATSTPNPTPATADATPTRTSAGAAPTHIPGPRSRPAPPAGVSLSDGGWLDVGLATVLIAAGALVWAHRRRRYIPQPPDAKLRLDDPDLQPLPEAIRRSRRVLQPIADADSAGEPHAPADAVTDINDTSHENGTAADTGAQPDQPTRLTLPGLSNPITSLWPPAGLGLIGPGAEHAARGFLVTALADAHDAQPDARTQVVIPSGTLATLLGTDAVLLGDSPRLHVTAGLGEALTLLEQTTLTRARMLYDNETDDIASLRTQDSFADPTPPLLLIADASAPHERTRIASVLTQGQPLDIAGILLGTWPAGNTVTVAVDGATTAADNRPRHGPHPTDVGRLTVLGAGQAADLLRTAIEADTGQAQPTTPGPARERAATEDRPDLTSQRTESATGDEKPDEPARAERVAGADKSAEDAANGGPAAPPRSVEDHAASDVSTSHEQISAAAPQPARIGVLGGPPQIVGLPPDSKDKPPLRVKSREILAYLMAHPRGVTEEALYDEVLPDLKVSTAAAMLNTYVYNLRRNLRAVAGPGDYLLRPKQVARCDLEAGRFDCDLWRMRHHLQDAQTATDPATRIAALHAAIGEHTGPFADGCAYEWVEPVREAIRRQAIDAHATLAEMLAETDRPGALAVLDQAIAQDPYNEALYRQAMRLHAADRNIAAIRQLRRDLTRHLADIPAEPSDDTITLADQLAVGASRSHRGGV
jgi:DNA-binding SARP family transcriptional activator